MYSTLCGATKAICVTKLHPELELLEVWMCECLSRILLYC